MGLNDMIAALGSGTAGAGFPLNGGAGAYQLNPLGRVVAYVGPAYGSEPESVRKFRVATMAEALPRVEAGRGDIIVCLPGYDETLADATVFGANLKAGTTIMGVGDPRRANSPRITWGAAGARMDVDAADVSIVNMNLQMNGANGVTNCIDIGADGDGFQMRGCYMDWGIDASNHAAIALTIAAATDVLLQGNEVYGAVAGAVANGILVSGVASRLRILDNHIHAASAVATGLINITGAALGIKIGRNVLANTVASSDAAIVLGAAASSGEIFDNRISVNTGTAAAAGIEVNATSLCRLFENYNSDGALLTGILTGTPAT